MNDQPKGSRKVLSDAEQQQNERVCEQFRAAWEAGQRPRIEDFLATASAAARAELLERLVAEELAYRSRSGEIPKPEEYEQRFPADAATVRQAFSRPLHSTSEHSTYSKREAGLAETETEAWQGPNTQAGVSAEHVEHIGRYKVTGILGRGGFGTVYRARDEELQRDVAIKVWRRDRSVGDEAVERLVEEARHVARLEKHPAIVGVYDVGRQEDGSVFIVLQYIKGRSLDQELKSHKLGFDRVWEIMLQVTSAIQHAHATGLVHRDLKPANVLLDADGNAHVADFGLAIDDDNQRFHAGEVSGTPAYMAPEQVRGEAHRLDGRADLWALGVMLYQMLTHRRPFQGKTHQELFDEILHREPKPPRQLNPEIPADLERICLKCLAKPVTERYLTAADLAKDLRHAQEAPQRRKRRLTTIASAVVAALLVLGAVWAFVATRREQPVISVQPGSGLQIRHRGTLRGHAAAVWWVAFSPDDRTLASAGVDMAIKLWDVSGGHEVQEMTGHRGEVRCVTFAPDGRTLASASGDRSIVVWDREDGEMKRQITGHTGDVRSVVFMPSGKQLVSGSVDKTIRFWDPQSGSEQRKLDAHRAAVQSVACSPNGKTIASASDDKTICLLNPETGELLQTLTGHADGVTQAAFSPDGRRLASASWDKTIRIWEVATGKLLLTIDKQEAAVRSVAFSANGKRLASGGDDNTIWLWDAEKGKELATLRGHRGPVTSVAFSADGRILASASADRTVMMWELEEADPAKPVDRPSVAATGRQPAKDQPAGPKPSVTELERGKQPAKDAVGPTPLPASPTPNTIAPKQPQEPPSVGPATVAKVPEEKPQGPPAADRPPERKPAEWITLEIERELLGWKAYGSGTWSVEAGGVLKGEGGSGWLGTDQEYDDFELKLEFRLGKDSNSGIFLRAWPNGQPDGRDFLKIQLLDDTSPKFAAVGPTERTASVYQTVAPSPPVQGAPGEWHPITIRAEGPTVKVQYDGQAVIDADLNKADTEIEGHRRVSGRIGLQALSGTVEFRNIAIRRLVRPQSAATSPAPPLAIAPFNAATARKHQEAWAKYLGVPVEMTNSIGMKFVLIPPGEFDMGSTEAEVAKLLEEEKTKNLISLYTERLPSEAPKHKVRITKPFWLGVHEVTRGQFRRFVDDRGYQTEAERDGRGGTGLVGGEWKREPRFVWNADLGFEQEDDHPVVNVSWNDVTAFCAWLSEKEGEKSSLPSEAQWEYACRAGTTTRWYSGDDEEVLKEHAWFDFNADKKIHPVGQKSPNAWGLFDMHGNVWEWCQDWFGDGYYATSPLNDPTGPSGGSFRATRGGCSDADASGGRASRRARGTLGYGWHYRGFRLARAVSLAEDEVAAPQESVAEPPQSKDRPSEEPSVPATPSSAKPAPPWTLPAGAPAPAIAPFDAARAKEHQEAWGKHLGVPVEMENSIGMRFVLIPPGEFDMGSTEAEVAKLLEEAKATNQQDEYIKRLPAEAPKHRVRITKPFWLGVHEVTRGQFRRFVEDRGYQTEAERDGRGGHGLVDGQWKQDPRFVWNRDLGFEQADDHPVVNVSWNDATAFCSWLSEKEGEKSSLLSEAQWEYACRAGTTTTWCSGDDEEALKEHGWFKANAERQTHPVGQKWPNAWGLYDMHGNVWEWCQDWWVEGYYATSPLDDPTGPTGGSYRVLRGGGWYFGAPRCRASVRSRWLDPVVRDDALGFRLARAVSLPQ
jgi:formylglycine-generating enzyme required for sulfatase activity